MCKFLHGLDFSAIKNLITDHRLSLVKSAWFAAIFNHLKTNSLVRLEYICYRPIPNNAVITLIEKIIWKKYFVLKKKSPDLSNDPGSL